jgi:hypothetical protein
LRIKATVDVSDRQKIEQELSITILLVLLMTPDLKLGKFAELLARYKTFPVPVDKNSVTA